MVIARGVVSHSEVNAQSVIGAITIYVLLGMLFVTAFTVTARYRIADSVYIHTVPLTQALR